MSANIDILRDEVRSGFYIPTAIKQAWASQLKIMSAIDKVCKKYDICYFADWGTLLGTVRHGGYVPWDDDMDICMKRADYMRFREVADQELPEGFAIQDYERKENHWLFLSRVVNCNQINFEKEHLDEYHNFPYIAGIDIFVLDYLYADEELEKKRCEEVKHIIAVADGIVGNRFSAQTVAYQLDEIEKTYHICLDKDKGVRHLGVQLYRLAEQQMGRTKPEESKNIGQIFPWVLKGDRGKPKELYDKAIRLPYENTTIPVPSNYHRALTSRYRDYFKIYKSWNGHDYPYFEGQRKNLQAVVDFQLPEFSFKPHMLQRQEAEETIDGSLKNIAQECFEQLQQYHKAIKGCESKDDIVNYLVSCQQLAIDLGTLTENVKGEDNPSCQRLVSQLEMYCEALYVCYEYISGEENQSSEEFEEKMNSFFDMLEKTGETIQNEIINRKEILFISTGEKQWRTFASHYEKEQSHDDVDVYVIEVPVFEKDIFGEVKDLSKDLNQLVDNNHRGEHIRMLDWRSYSLELHHPDRIYIQDPYDGENPCLTIPAVFYARNLQKYTEELVYVPQYIVSEFGENDYTDVYNLKHYVSAPGVIYADKVMVQSNNIKSQYVKHLVRFAGEDTKNVWENKIVVDESMLTQDAESAQLKALHSEGKKKVLFGVGIHELAESGVAFVEKLEKRFRVFEKYSDKVQVGICTYPSDWNEWMALDKENAMKIQKLINKYLEMSWCHWQDISIQETVELVLDYDGYYGSPCYVAHLFNYAEKPVMIGESTVSLGE